jgi:putative addiction module component (TIGR02574 family)
MTSLITTLGIDRMSAAERLQIVRELLDTLAPEAEASPLLDSQRQELDRRTAALDSGAMKRSTWEEVEARVLARLPS